MVFLSKNTVVETVKKAITDRLVLELIYQRTSDAEVVTHRIAPFDIGSTNPDPKKRNQNQDNLYAYSYTHVDGKTNRPAPKVCPFNIGHCISLTLTRETFDESELARKNCDATRFDYRVYRFALLPHRHWFGR